MIKRLNHSGSNDDAYLASSLRQAMCMSSSSVVRLTISNHPFCSVQWGSSWRRFPSC